jgi:glucose-6-phosphate dehydrogenase assembly protein OpcA
MAGAVTGRPGSKVGAGLNSDGGARPVQKWRKQEASVSDLLAALPSLRRQVAGHEAGTRMTVMTIVMVSEGGPASRDCAHSVRAIGAHHPCRFLLLRPDPEGTPAIDAEMSLWRAEPPEGALQPLFFEEIHLRVAGQAASHLASIASPFVLADLPVLIWFPERLPDPADPLLRLATALVTDTRALAEGEIAPSYRTLLELANRQPVVDLSWVRLQPWRELLAGLFEAGHNSWFLQGVRLATVKGKPGPRHMLGGWLMAQLDLRARELALFDAKHVDITLEAAYDGEQGTFSVHRDEQSRAVWARAELSSGVTHGQALPLPDDSLTSALASAISNLRADRVWERALASAAALASY